MREILHYGVRSQPQRYHLQIRYIAPDRLIVERNDFPSVTVDVGVTSCGGPTRWHCDHQRFPVMRTLLAGFLLPEPGVAESPIAHTSFTWLGPTTLRIRALGDPWSCPPFSQGCNIFTISTLKTIARIHYTAIVVFNRRTGLPETWKSWESHPHASTTSRQLIHFSYTSTFSIHLPHYPRWTCPRWWPRGTWCMKEPGQ